MRVVFDFDEKKPRLEGEKVTVVASEFRDYRDYIKFFRWLRVLVLKSRPTRKQHLLFPQKVEKKSIVDNLIGGKQGELNAGTEQTESSEPGPESKPKPKSRKPRAKRAA